jgi:hypothetical protein
MTTSRCLHHINLYGEKQEYAANALPAGESADDVDGEVRGRTVSSFIKKEVYGH